MSKIADLIDQLECLLEQADSNYELKQKIRNQSPTIFEHIYKIIVYSEKYPQDVNHWAREIRGSLRQFCRKKLKNNKELTVEQITEILISKFVDYDEFYEIVDICEEDYGFIPDDINVDKVYDKIIEKIPLLIQYVKSTNIINTGIILDIINKD